MDRKGRPAEHVAKPALTLGLALQPEVLTDIARMPGFRGRGLLARILYSLPENTIDRRLQPRNRLRYARAFDIVDEPAVSTAVASVEEELGKIDVLVNNAGIQHREPLLDVSLENWQRVLGVNLTGAFVVGRSVAAGMVAHGQGKIVNICSVRLTSPAPPSAPTPRPRARCAT